MASSFRVQEIRYREESSFAENINSVTSNTYSTRLPIVGLPTVTLTQDRIDDTSLQNRNDLRLPGLAGPRSCSIEFTTYAVGHMAATTGALTETWAYKLLKNGLGGGNAADSGTDIDTGAGTPDADTIYTTANPADHAVGSILRVGAKGDGRAEGAAAAVSTVSTQTVELLTALPGSAADTDVVYATMQAYPSNGFTDSGGTTQSVAFIASHTDTGAQWHLIGCQLAGLTVNFQVGAIPTITWQYSGVYWERGADTTPSAVALSDNLSGPVAGGDLYYQTVATTTRNTISAQSMSLSVGIGLVPHTTVGGSATYQTITGWTRTNTTVGLDISIHTWDSAYETLWDSDGSNSTYKHVLFQSNASDGRVFGFYLPKTFIAGPRPTREQVDDLTGVSFNLQATEGPDTTSDLSRSPVRFFMG